MKERIREIITNPIIVILLIAFAVSGVIIYGISSNMAEQKSEIVNSLDISSVSRDKDGKLIDVSAMGVTVEETGKSYTTPITIAALLAGGGICGVSAIIFAAGKKKRNEEQA